MYIYIFKDSSVLEKHSGKNIGQDDISYVLWFKNQCVHSILRHSERFPEVCHQLKNKSLPLLATKVG